MTTRTGRRVFATGILILMGMFFGDVAEAISLAVCTTDSQIGVIIQSAPCGIYGIVETRTEAYGTPPAPTPISVRFMTHAPTGAPKGIVFLLPGGAGGAGLDGIPGQPPVSANNNFLVRTAQLQAENGFLAITTGRPLFNNNPETPEGVELIFDYRLTSRHAVDIVSVLNTVIASNPGAYGNLRVFLAGTSASTVGAMAQARLVSGVHLSSPVTAGMPTPFNLYIGNPLFPQLVPANMPVPVHVMSHKDDSCAPTLPENAKVIYQQFRAAGVHAEYDELNGGFTMAGMVIPPDPMPIHECQALTFHGFLGIENKAVREMTKLFEDVLGDLARRYRGNRKPVIVTPGVLSAAVGVLDLSPLVSDPDGDPVTFTLPYATSNRGATLVLNGSTVTYLAGGGSALPDAFVYIASDGKGGVTPAVVTVVGP